MFTSAYRAFKNMKKNTNAVVRYKTICILICKKPIEWKDTAVITQIIVVCFILTMLVKPILCLTNTCII